MNGERMGRLMYALVGLFIGVMLCALIGCTAVTVQCSGRDTLDGGLGSATTGEAATAQIVEDVVEGATQ